VPRIGNFLSHELYCAYLRGGRLWPQKRGGINISLLSAYFKGGSQVNDIRTLAHVCFNEKQIQATKTIMIQDHMKGGIRLPETLPDALIKKEWLKARSYALMSLQSFVQDAKVVKTSNDISEEELMDLANYLNDFFLDAKRKEQRKDLIKEMTEEANRILWEHSALAKLFILSNYGDTQFKNTYINSSKKFDEISSQYGLSLKDNSPQEIKEKCCAIIKKILSDNLGRQFPVPHHWLVQGFTEDTKLSRFT
jgi:hypothetical protein